MIDGLIISVVGMTSVFVILTVMMLLMQGLERLFRSEEVVETAGLSLDYKDISEMDEMAAIALAVILHKKRVKKKALKRLI